MGLRFSSQQHGECFFVTTTFRDWRQHGNSPGFYQDLAESLRFCLDKYAAQLAGYALMPSHVHLVVFINGTQLSGMMRDFNKYTGQKIAADRGIKGGIWMPRYDRVAIWSGEMMRTKLECIHQNPVKAGLVAVAADWRWSSASDYLTDGKGPLPVWKNW
jgi:REP element-mobilizing transposase RayT